MAKAAAKAPEAGGGDAPKKSKLPLIIALVVVLLAGGAGAWFFMMRVPADDDEHTQVSAKPPIFLPLDQFTVNLQPEDGQQFLQVAMTLKVVDQQIADHIKTMMPEVRSRVLLLLSSKKPSQIGSLDGKTTLADEIIHEIEQTMPFEKKKKKKKKRKAKSEDAEETSDAQAEKDEKKDARSRKARAKDEDDEDEDLPERVQAVFFTHFIVQ
jgi:flagellar FliL protein